METDNRLLR